MKTQIYFVLGPTASGKSKFALSLAHKLNGEIINADSMQIYHELSILTARPTINDQKKINHHLYGFIKGDVRFNVQKWCEAASKKINYLVDKNIIPILVGGTGLYIESLINGIISIDDVDSSLQNGDIITEVNREIINNMNSFEELVNSLEKTGRSSLLLKIIRDNEQNCVTIKFKNN